MYEYTQSKSNNKVNEPLGTEQNLHGLHTDSKMFLKHKQLFFPSIPISLLQENQQVAPPKKKKMTIGFLSRTDRGDVINILLLYSGDVNIYLLNQHLKSLTGALLH